MRASAFVLVLLAPLAALAQPALDDVAEDAEAYCGANIGVAKSQSALLFSPQIFLDYGVVNGNDASTGTGGVASLPPTQRLTIGARYSLVGLYKGVANRQRASADCTRHRAAAGLARFLVENREQLSPGALDAKLAVLRAALPKAHEIVRSLRGQVEHSARHRRRAAGDRAARRRPQRAAGRGRGAARRAAVALDAAVAAGAARAASPGRRRAGPPRGAPAPGRGVRRHHPRRLRSLLRPARRGAAVRGGVADDQPGRLLSAVRRVGRGQGAGAGAARGERRRRAEGGAVGRAAARRRWRASGGASASCACS